MMNHRWVNVRKELQRDFKLGHSTDEKLSSEETESDSFEGY